MIIEQQLEHRRKIGKQVINELREIRDNALPEPQSNWDLVWVLSGPEITLEEMGIFGGINENQSRLITGFAIIKDITACRLQLTVADVTDNHTRDYGPDLYFNGTEEHNNLLRRLQADSFFAEYYQFPDDKIIVAREGTNIAHTGDQFEKFPVGLIEGKRQIIIITSARHIPRVRRYMGFSTNPFHHIQDRVIFYPALPLNFPLKGTRDEIKKIPIYQELGILPAEECSV